MGICYQSKLDSSFSFNTVLTKMPAYKIDPNPCYRQVSSTSSELNKAHNYSLGDIFLSQTNLKWLIPRTFPSITPSNDPYYHLSAVYHPVTESMLVGLFDESYFYTSLLCPISEHLIHHSISHHSLFF